MIIATLNDHQLAEELQAWRTEDTYLAVSGLGLIAALWPLPDCSLAKLAVGLKVNIKRSDFMESAIVLDSSLHGRKRDMLF